MKRSLTYIISLLLLVTIPVTGLGLTVFHHHCSITNEDSYSINSSKLCNCHHEENQIDPCSEMHCALPSANHIKHEHSTKKHSHLHTKDHCSHCNSIGNGSQVTITKHCCETTVKASSPVAVYVQHSRMDLIPAPQLLAVLAPTSFNLDPQDNSSILRYEPPPPAEQQKSIIQYIIFSSRQTSSEDSDSDC